MGVFDVTGSAGSALLSVDSSGNVTTAGTLAPGGAIVAGTISEAVAAAGVTVDSCLIKDGYAAGPPTASLFTSTIQTGTGGAQNIAHGFGSVPRMYWVEIADASAAVTPPIFVKGTPTTTNLVITATADLTYFVHAIK